MGNKKKEITDVLKHIAQKEGRTVQEVRHEIQISIDSAIQSDSSQTQIFWKNFSKSRNMPTPEEVLISH